MQFFSHISSRVYIKQNTLVGGAEKSAGKNENEYIGKKIKMRKGRGEGTKKLKGLKGSFWAINS